MRKNPLILLAILIPTVIIAILLAFNFTGRSVNPFASPTPFPTIASDSETISDSITTAPASSENIEILSPRSGDTVGSGFAVKGNARTFESNVVIRLLDSEGNVLIETYTTANAPDAGQFGPFEKVLEFQTDDSAGTLDVFQYSAKDGSEIDKVTIPVIFKKN
ncbi:MAG: Gmad2 immunoglobulin-like domain-containing protein [Candidatus Levybacteria bacterium]|nr:Gmad2 immunoglobulin-like domain-containing protein [Candidatus Levybacteria bacterium]